MTLKRIMKTTLLKATVAVSAASIIALVGSGLGPVRVHADDSDTDQNLAAIGLRIAPKFINMTGKDPTLVGLGSFIVNAQADCNGCHGSNPASEFPPTNNPYFRKPNNAPIIFNQATYLVGGQNFGPVGPGIVKDPNSPLYAGPGLGPNIITRNLTPDYTGYPAGGMDLYKFISIMRTGHDVDSLHPNCGPAVVFGFNGLRDYEDNCYSAPVDGGLLQVMPWTKFQNMTDYQLTAIWTYLSTVPCNAHKDDLGNTFPWLANKCTP
jgi:hypothetical protein